MLVGRDRRPEGLAGVGRCRRRSLGDGHVEMIGEEAPEWLVAAVLPNRQPTLLAALAVLAKASAPAAFFWQTVAAIPGRRR